MGCVSGLAGLCRGKADVIVGGAACPHVASRHVLACVWHLAHQGCVAVISCTTGIVLLRRHSLHFA